MSNPRNFLLSLLVFALVLVMVTLIQSGPKSLAWGKNYHEALERAKSREQVIITYLFTDWCSYCKKMERETFADASLVEEMGSQYVWLKLNTERDREGVRLQRELRVTGFPTVVIMNSAGQELGRAQGFLSPERFRKTIQRIVENPDLFGRKQLSEGQNSTLVIPI